MLRTLSLLLCSLFLGAQSSLEWNFEKDDFSRDASFWSTNTHRIQLNDFSFFGFSAYSFQETELQIEIRFLSQSEWTEWQAFNKQAHDELITDRQVWVSKLISQEVEAWQLRLKEKPRSPLTLRLFIAHQPSASKLKTHAPSFNLESNNCSCPQPSYCDRTCWCPNNDCPPPSSYSPTVPTHLIVHHSAGANSSNNFAGVVAYYWDLHVNTNGWSDIGYNWLIDPNGVVYEGRGSGTIGAHFSCLNSGTTGICIIGDYRNSQPSSASLIALSDLLLYESCLNGISPADTSIHQSSQLVLRHISGHRDANTATVGCPSGTVCPGQVLYNKLDSIASAINQDACLLSRPETAFFSGQHFYPVPSKNYIRSESSEPISNCVIIDSQGRVFPLPKINANQWDLRKFGAGIYSLHYEINGSRYQQTISIL